jgi:subtilase family serine protease
MGPVFKAGYNGTGETIVIVDAYGSTQIAQEADVFSQIYGLPRITSSNFQQLRAPGAVHNTSPHFGGGSPAWHDEIALDVEWSHAMAPGAKIVLVVGPNNGSDLDEAINYAVVHHIGNTISNSWSSLEGFGNPAQLNRMNRILMSAAAQGIDVNFSSGDFGDNEARVGFKTVDFPGSSPFATSIGGTSLFLNNDNTIKFQTGWGTNETRIADISPSAGKVTDDNPPVDPPLHFGFIFGAGGGSSLTFPKPSWQAGLPGTTRQVPDISLFADPFTGAEIISTDLSTGELVVGVIGGTSLSCPAFSGIMADAAQKHGHVGFGQVAPLLYNLRAGAITDVPGSFAASATNVAGSITDAKGTKQYSADDLAGPLDGATNYVSAFYNSPFSTRYFVLTFGTDTSLKTATGWDNVTGLGTPNGAAFVNAIAP